MEFKSRWQNQYYGERVLIYNSDLVYWLEDDWGASLTMDLVSIGLATTFNLNAKCDDVWVEAPAIMGKTTMHGIQTSNGPAGDTQNKLPPFPEDLSQIKPLPEALKKHFGK